MVSRDSSSTSNKARTHQPRTRVGGPRCMTHPSTVMWKLFVSSLNKVRMHQPRTRMAGLRCINLHDESTYGHVTCGSCTLARRAWCRLNHPGQAGYSPLACGIARWTCRSHPLPHRARRGVADVTARTEEGSTPLHLASRAGHASVRVARVLLGTVQIQPPMKT